MAGENDTGPGENYVTPKGIIWVALYLILCTLLPMAGLVKLWPSCEMVNDTASHESTLTVTSIFPNSGTIKGDEMVSILGTGFEDGVIVNFGKVPAIEAKIVDSTRLRVSTPAHEKGVVDIVVNNHGKAIRALTPGFLYIDPQSPPKKASINSVAPVSGPSTGGQSVKITGTGFANVTKLTFDDIPSTNIQVLNDSTLLATTPPHTEGKVNVAVDTGDAALLPNGYTYDACWTGKPFNLFLMIILAGTLGSGLHGLRSLFWYVGNRELRESWILMYILLPISGAAIAVIFFLATSAGLYTIQGTGNLILIGLAALVGMFSAQAAEKLKKIAEGLLTTAPQGENAVLPQPPKPQVKPDDLSVASINPSSGSAKGGAEVTITGKGFAEGVTVSFGENAATQKSLSPTSIIVTTPSHVPGKVDVVVRNKDGTSVTASKAYTYVAE